MRDARQQVQQRRCQVHSPVALAGRHRELISLQAAEGGSIPPLLAVVQLGAAAAAQHGPAAETRAALPGGVGKEEGDAGLAQLGEA